MGVFRRVDARQAGQEALGILVPPGERTVVILRPRGLVWDLLPLQPGLEHVQPAVFATRSRDSAAHLARGVQQALERTLGLLPHPLEVACASPGSAYGVCARLEECLWIVCRRAAGKAYEPALFASVAEAEAVMAQLLPYLWPSNDAVREYYFNTQAFYQ
jgi:hypothetical protein